MPEAKVDIVIRGGEVVISSQVWKVSVAINEGKFVGIGAEEFLPPARRYIDATGRYVLPGVIDGHVHLLEWRQEAISAAHGGITTFVPYILPGLTEDAEAGLLGSFASFRDEGECNSVVDFAVHGGLLERPAFLEEIPKLFEQGVTTYKMLMAYREYGGMCHDDFLLPAMEVIGGHGGMVMLHAENGDLVYYIEKRMIAKGDVKPKSHCVARPIMAEVEAIDRGLRIAAFANCPVYIVHLSTKEGLDCIKANKLAGERVLTETCPQYLLLTEDEMERSGPLAKMNPPLRRAADLEALWRGLEEGWISIVGSDHGGFTKEEKRPGWDNIFVTPEGAPVGPGAPGTETMLPLLYSEGVEKRGLPIWWLARVVSENPAKVFGLYPRKGTIQIGSDADLVILDPQKRRTLRAADLHGRSDYTLFEGVEVQGWPIMTLLRGQVLLNEGKLEQEPGYGKYIRCEKPALPVASAVK